jgi:pimeloyl-ACP methyl ester carboxylesterase
MDWVYEHFASWVKSLRLPEPAILIGHSMGGYVALEFARRVSAWTRGLILVDPFYSRSQLPRLLRNTYSHAGLSSFIIGRAPEWMFRFFVDLSSVATGHSVGALHSLPETIRAQTALDFKRTATLVVWGDRDRTLAPSSFSYLVNQLPKARGEILHAGHVPHQSHPKEFNQIVMEFLKELG